MGSRAASAEGLGPISCYGLTNNNQAAAKLWDAPGGTGTPYQLSVPDVAHTDWRDTKIPILPKPSSTSAGANCANYNKRAKKKSAAPAT